MSDLPPPVPANTPPLPVAYPVPLPYRDQRKTDADHLRLLSIFSYVSAGLALLGLVFVALHYNMMRMVVDNPQMFQQTHRPPGPDPTVAFRQMFLYFRWFYVAFALFGVVMAVLNVVSGYCIGTRRNRIFILIVAALNCIRMPLGTALGVCTFLVLTRDSVRQLFEGTDAKIGIANAEKLPL